MRGRELGAFVPAGNTVSGHEGIPLPRKDLVVVVGESAVTFALRAATSWIIPSGRSHHGGFIGRSAHSRTQDAACRRGFQRAAARRGNSGRVRSLGGISRGGPGFAFEPAYRDLEQRIADFEHRHAHHVGLGDCRGSRARAARSTCCADARCGQEDHQGRCPAEDHESCCAAGQHVVQRRLLPQFFGGLRRAPCSGSDCPCRRDGEVQGRQLQLQPASLGNLFGPWRCRAVALVAPAEELAGGNAGELAAIAAQVRLIGVTRVGRQ